MNGFIKSICISIIVIGGGFLPVVVMALEGDRDEPVYIEADEFIVDQKNKTSTYQGNVSFKQGSVILEADRITVVGSQGLDKIIAQGQPARYRQLLKKGSEEVVQKIRGEANSLEYFVNREQLIFNGQAHLWRDQDEFIGDYIEYDMRHNRVNAKRMAGSQNRVKVIIQPRNKKEAPPK